MRRMIAALLLCFPALACAAVPASEGRWEGRIEVPGRELQVVVDLAQGASGSWAGSIIIPGLGIKGTPLSNIVATATEVTFELGNPLSTPGYGPARFKAQLDAGNAMAGEMSQAGNVAKFSLRKIGPAQVDSPVRSTAVRRSLEDQWNGEFELGGYPRHVTITLENHADAAATAKFLVVGKQVNDLPVDLVIEEDGLLRIESQSTRVTFEGRFLEDHDEIRGTIDLISFELPLILHRSARRTS